MENYEIEQAAEIIKRLYTDRVVVPNREEATRLALRNLVRREERELVQTREEVQYRHDKEFKIAAQLQEARSLLEQWVDGDIVFSPDSRGLDAWVCTECGALELARRGEDGHLLPNPQPFPHHAGCKVAATRAFLIQAL